MKTPVTITWTYTIEIDLPDDIGIDGLTPQQAYDAKCEAYRQLQASEGQITLGNKPIDLTEEMLTNAGFPQELRRFIDDGTLRHYLTDADGTLNFHVPKKNETRLSVTFHWHPNNPETWCFDGSRFFAEAEHFHDREQCSPAGSEAVDDINNDSDPNDISLLIDWLETEDD